MPERKAPRCRKCGCFDFVHNPAYAYYGPNVAHRFSKATRLELWFHDHDTIWAHVKAWAWLNLRNGNSRMAYIERLFARRPELCWCDLVDSWWHAEPQMRGDYRKPNGCVCHFPMPAMTRLRDPDVDCYCTPADGRALDVYSLAAEAEEATGG